MNTLLKATLASKLSQIAYDSDQMSIEKCARMEVSQPLRAPLAMLDHSHSWYSVKISIVATCDHCLTPFHWAPEKNLALSSLYSVRLLKTATTSLQPSLLQIKQTQLPQPPLMGVCVCLEGWGWQKQANPQKDHKRKMLKIPEESN